MTTATVTPEANDVLDAGIAKALRLIELMAWADALACCNDILAIAPMHAKAHHLASYAAGRLAANDAGMYDLALSHAQMAVQIDPYQPLYRYNLAVDLNLRGRENEAAIHYQVCLRQEPDHQNALWNYGEMLRLAEHFDLAAVLLERFAANGGNYPALHHRLAVTYGALGWDDKAEAHFIRELGASDMPDALTRWEYALFLLSRERFEQGFANYERRFQAGGRNSVFCHPFDIPLWHGQLTRGSTLLVHGEQGLGDEMMFASLLPEVLASARQSQSRIILAVKPPLVQLFSMCFPDAVVRPHRVGSAALDVSEFGAINWQVPIGNLAVLFRRKLDDFKLGQLPYLFADSQRAKWYADQLELMEPPKMPTSARGTTEPARPVLRVGLMWGSNPAPVNDKFVRWSQQRSIPVQMFERLAHLVPHLRFVSLQNRERGHEAALAPKLDIFDFSEQQTDFFETAALIQNLDLVISVDTSIAHLAGAMGKETWVPLMSRADWRHGHLRSHSYWYSNTRYFHQSANGDWAPVVDALADALEERLQQTTSAIKNMAPTMPDKSVADDFQADLNLALMWLNRREFDQARPYFEKALSTSDNSPRVQWEYAMQLLTEGFSVGSSKEQTDARLARGWDYHEARHAIFGWEKLHLCPLPWPVWTGQPLKGCTIVVHAEQGIGDEIMHASMLTDLVDMGGRVALACVPSLVALMQFSFPTIVVFPHPRGNTQDWHMTLPAWTRSIVKELGSVDFQISMLSLGQQLRRKTTDFHRQAYLFPDPKRVAAMAKHLNQTAYVKLPAKASPKLRVGLAWCGSLGDENARARSIELVKLLPLATVGKTLGVQFFSLQSRQFAKQASEVPELSLIDMSEFTDDFADVAALMAHLDLVISIDTSYAHLSGALGIPTWRLVIRTCDWRWGWGRADSLWYPHDRLFRQDHDGDWDTVINHVANELISFKNQIQA